MRVNRQFANPIYNSRSFITSPSIHFMSLPWAGVVISLTFSPFLSSYLHFDLTYSFTPEFLIFRHYNCCEIEETGITNYIKSSNLSVNITPTANPICANVESPSEEYTKHSKGYILIILSEEEEDEPFCNAYHTITAIGIYRMWKEGAPKWQGQIMGVQDDRLDVDKGLHIGDWPDRVESSLEIRILIESSILVHQRKIVNNEEVTTEEEEKTDGDKFKTGHKVALPREKDTNPETNGHGLDTDVLVERKEPQKLHYLWLFSIIPVLLVLICAFSYYRYKQKRNQLLARKTYIKVVYKADDSVGHVQWHESSQSASEEDRSSFDPPLSPFDNSLRSSSSNSSKSSSKSKNTKKRSRSVKEFMHEYFERFSSDQ